MKTAVISRLVASLAYFTIFGWIISYFFLYPKNKSSLGILHLRQGLVLHLIFVVMGFINQSYTFFNGRLPRNIAGFMMIFVVYLCIMGIVDAIRGSEMRLPIFGEPAQRWFRNL